MEARAGTCDERTGVVVVGADPGGLTVANLLRAGGVDCVLLETESREFVEQRPRAGFLAEWAVRALERRGLAGPELLGAEAQRDCEFRFRGGRHVFRYGQLSGFSHFVRPQQLLVTDLVRTYADEAGGDVRFGRRLARAARAGAARRVVFGLHPRGFAAHMARSPEVTRHYLECWPGDSADDWPHERVWSELRAPSGCGSTRSSTMAVGDPARPVLGRPVPCGCGRGAAARMTRSDAAGAALAGLYIGSDADH